MFESIFLQKYCWSFPRRLQQRQCHLLMTWCVCCLLVCASTGPPFSLYNWYVPTFFLLFSVFLKEITMMASSRFRFQTTEVAEITSYKRKRQRVVKETVAPRKREKERIIEPEKPSFWQFLFPRVKKKSFKERILKVRIQDLWFERSFLALYGFFS